MLTDLDGCLLDQHNYSYKDALFQMQNLERERIPLRFSSSKTRSEIASLQAEVGNTHLFIVENGAAVFIPEQTESRDGYWINEMSEPGGRWLALILSYQVVGALIQPH